MWPQYVMFVLYGFNFISSLIRFIWYSFTAVKTDDARYVGGMLNNLFLLTCTLFFGYTLYSGHFFSVWGWN